MFRSVALNRAVNLILMFFFSVDSSLCAWSSLYIALSLRLIQGQRVGDAHRGGHQGELWCRCEPLKGDTL